MDNNTTNITREIIRECTNKGIPVYENFVSHYVQLMALDPTWGIAHDAVLNREQVHKFVTCCVYKLEHQYCICLLILKMQLYFSNNFETSEDMVFKNRTNLKTRLGSLENEIMQTESSSTAEMEKLYKKIVYYITLSSGLGNPTLNPVYVEAQAALQSIFNQNDMKDFISRDSSDKELEIVELTELVTGIRLFNRDCKKGGEGIEDLPAILNQAIDATNSNVQKVLIETMDTVNMLTTAVDNCIKIDKNEQGYCLSCQLPEEITEDDLEGVKDALVFFRQFELFIRKILVEVNKIEKLSHDIFENLRTTLVKLHETVRLRTAIPTCQVFPLFTEISQIWCHLQDQTIFLSQLNQIFVNVQLYVKQIKLDEDVLTVMVGEDGPLTDAERLEKTTGLMIPFIGSDVQIVEPSQIRNFDKVRLQYLGFCAWKLIETQGALIPGNPNMGVAKINNMYFAFSSVEAAIAFGKDPERYILRGLELARQKPELINFLLLHEQLENVRKIGQLVIEVPEVTITHEISVQTDLHPIPANFDLKYKNNIWDLKRQAICLANVSKCNTNSTQTEKSNCRGAIKTQTYETKDKVNQTKKDNYTNVPTLSNFIYGLRGTRDDNQHIITLTRPVDE